MFVTYPGCVRRVCRSTCNWGAFNVWGWNQKRLDCLPIFKPKNQPIGGLPTKKWDVVSCFSKPAVCFLNTNIFLMAFLSRTHRLLCHWNLKHLNRPTSKIPRKVRAEEAGNLHRWHQTWLHHVYLGNPPTDGYLNRKIHCRLWLLEGNPLVLPRMTTHKRGSRFMKRFSTKPVFRFEQLCNTRGDGIRCGISHEKNKCFMQHKGSQSSDSVNRWFRKAAESYGL